MRHFTTFSLLVASVAALSGCMSKRAAKELGEYIAAPINVIAQSMSGSLELAYATAAFQRKNGRWPKDYAELSAFVAESDGLLILGQYDRVDFSDEPAGGLHVAFVPHGQTNQVSFTVPPKDMKPK